MSNRRVFIEGGYCTFTGGGYDYSIAMSRIKTQREVLAWVHHVSSKTWATKRDMQQFVELICKARGWSVATP